MLDLRPERLFISGLWIRTYGICVFPGSIQMSVLLIRLQASHGEGPLAALDVIGVATGEREVNAIAIALEARPPP